MLRQLERLRSKCKGATRNLIDKLRFEVIPIAVNAGFAISNEYTRNQRNSDGLIWSINEIPLQDRSVDSWPTIVIRIDRDLWPNFRVEVSLIPQNPITCDGRALPRTEASNSSSVKMLYLKRGESDAHWDQMFGPGWLNPCPRKKVYQHVGIAAALIARVVKIERDSFFLERVEAELGPRNCYQVWNVESEFRPNRST